MNKEDLIEIETELNRFKIVLNDAFLRSEENKGWEYNGEVVNVGNISGTKQAGSLKREALSFKRFLTEKLGR